MNAIVKFVVAALFAVVSVCAFTQTAPAVAEGAAVVSQWGSMTEPSCGQIFQCLSAEEMKTLSRKTLKYRHLRFQDFGYVYLGLKEGGKLKAGMTKGRPL